MGGGGKLALPDLLVARKQMNQYEHCTNKNHENRFLKVFLPKYKYNL